MCSITLSVTITFHAPKTITLTCYAPQRQNSIGLPVPAQAGQMPGGGGVLIKTNKKGIVVSTTKTSQI